MMNKKYFRSAILGVIFLLASVFSISSHTLAEGAPFYWNYINVDLDVQQNGDMLVTEIQQYNFTANHNNQRYHYFPSQQYDFTANHNNQRYRYIPLNKLNKISDVTVEENNQIIPSETGVENSQFWIRWQHPLKSPAIHTFTLKYRVVDVLRVNSQDTQLYWKAIFGDRQAPVKKATVKVHLPEVLAGKVTDFKYFGARAVSRELNPRTFEFVAFQAIRPQQELEVQVTFPSRYLNVSLSELELDSNLDRESNLASNFGKFSINLLGFSWPIFIVWIVWNIPMWMTREDRRCTRCNKIKLKRVYVTLLSATRTSTGMRSVTTECGNCHDYYAYDELIPVISDEGGGGDGGGGGGDGGGGGGDGGGGGGDGGGGGG